MVISGDLEQSLLLKVQARDEASAKFEKMSEGFKSAMGKFIAPWASAAVLARLAVRGITAAFELSDAAALRSAGIQEGNLAKILQGQLKTIEAYQDLARAIPFVGRAMTKMIGEMADTEGIRKHIEQVQEADDLYKEMIQHIGELMDAEQLRARQLMGVAPSEIEFLKAQQEAAKEDIRVGALQIGAGEMRKTVQEAEAKRAKAAAEYQEFMKYHPFSDLPRKGPVPGTQVWDPVYEALRDRLRAADKELEMWKEKLAEHEALIENGELRVSAIRSDAEEKRRQDQEAEHNKEIAEAERFGQNLIAQEKAASRARQAIIDERNAKAKADAEALEKRLDKESADELRRLQEGTEAVRKSENAKSDTLRAWALEQTKGMMPVGAGVLAARTTRFLSHTETGPGVSPLTASQMEILNEKLAQRLIMGLSEEVRNRLRETLIAK